MVNLIEDNKMVKKSAKEKKVPITQYQKTLLALDNYSKAKKEYYTLYYKKEKKEASIKTQADWKAIFPDISRPTIEDKKAHITMVMMDCYLELMDLRIERDYLKEIYEIEKLQLQKGVEL